MIYLQGKAEKTTFAAEKKQRLCKQENGFYSQFLP